MRSTSGSASSTAFSASRLLWISDSRASLAKEGRSGVDAFVSVLEEDAQGGGHRDSHEQSQDAAEVATHDERDDDQHRAEVDRIAEDLRRDEVIDNVRDHEVDH